MIFTHLCLSIALYVALESLSTILELPVRLHGTKTSTHFFAGSVMMFDLVEN